MKIDSEPPVERIDEQAAVRMILEGTASETGERFFAALVAQSLQSTQHYRSLGN